MSHTGLCLPSRSVHSFSVGMEGWKAELAWLAGDVVRQFTRIPLQTELNVALGSR